MTQTFEPVPYGVMRCRRMNLVRQLGVRPFLPGIGRLTPIYNLVTMILQCRLGGGGGDFRLDTVRGLLGGKDELCARRMVKIYTNNCISDAGISQQTPNGRTLVDPSA